MLALNLTPGPDMMYVIGRSIGQGRLAGVVSAMGIFTGCLVHILASAVGISAILAYSATVFTIVKYAGAGYLIYLGVKAFTSKAYAHEITASKKASLRACYIQGALTNALNPKVALFFLSFLPQFVSVESGHATLQLIGLGLIFDLSGSTVCAVVALVFGYAGARLISSKKFDKVRRYVSGSVFTALGIRLAFMKTGK